MQYSKPLGINKKLELLTMCNDYTGATEICTLYLDKAFRKNKLGRFLSKVRFMFMADHQARFSDTIIAEMRGVADENGIPPFWHWLQDTFFGIEFSTADHLVGTGDKGFISQLMPQYPIYVSTLPSEAQAVIGQVHKNTAPALELLRKEGFEHKGYVDLFDAGPTVETKLAHITSVSNSFLAEVLIDEQLTDEQEFDPELATWAMCNLDIKQFRACISQVVRVNEQCLPRVTLPTKVADALQVSSGDKLRMLAL